MFFCRFAHFSLFIYSDNNVNFWYDARAITCSTVVRMFLILWCFNVSTYEKSILRSVMLFTVKLSLKNCHIKSTLKGYFLSNLIANWQLKIAN